MADCIFEGLSARYVEEKKEKEERKKGKKKGRKERRKEEENDDEEENSAVLFGSLLLNKLFVWDFYFIFDRRSMTKL